MMLAFSFLVFFFLLYSVVQLIFSNPALFQLLVCMQAVLFVPAAILDCALFLSFRRLPGDVRDSASFFRWLRGGLSRRYRRWKARYK